MLTCDIVNIGELFQIIIRENTLTNIAFSDLDQVLYQLLNSNVDIGYAQNKSGNYVEFIAWRGNVQSKISRLFIDISNTKDWAFGTWLAQSKNVDSYES